MSTATPSATSTDIPSSVPGSSDVVRALFHYREDVALEFLLEDDDVYVLPWSARRGGIAGYRQSTDTLRARPVEFSQDDVQQLLTRHAHREVPLAATPAWLLQEDSEPPVSWHARVRWAERVEEMTDPAPAIRQAWRDGFQVGVPEGYGRYYPPADVVVCYFGHSSEEPTMITTAIDVEDIQENDKIGADHLEHCDVCPGAWNPQQTDACPWCGTRPVTPARRQLPARVIPDI